MRLKTPVFTLLFVASANISYAQTPFHFTAQQGPHPVGLKVVEQYDPSRVYGSTTDELGRPVSGERARPLQTLIWYPAQKSSGKPMTVNDYAQLASAETSFRKPDMSPEMKQWNIALTPTLRDSMWARRDAPLASGHFPVVIYAPSFSSMSWENADLCEYLASHGYVVIASAGIGAKTRDMTEDIAGANAQSRDIAFLVGYAQTLPDTDMSAVAVAGFSWGGLSGLFAAARDSRIDALVELDGSMRYYPGLIKQAGDVHPDQMTIPLIFFTQGEFTLEDQARYLNDPAKDTGPNALNAWTHGDLITVHDLALVHAEHSSMFQRNEDMWKDNADQKKADYGREYGVPGYAWVCRYTLAFLDTYLKHDQTALVFLKRTPAENEVPPHLISVQFRAATGVPASLDSFRAELGRQGFDHAPAIYAAIKKENSDFSLDDDAMSGWGNNLMQSGHLVEAIAILKLNIQNHPDSSDSYTVLGETYVRHGQEELARDSFDKALEKDPNNRKAKEQLKKLDTAAATPK